MITLLFIGGRGRGKGKGRGRGRGKGRRRGRGRRRRRGRGGGGRGTSNINISTNSINTKISHTLPCPFNKHRTHNTSFQNLHHMHCILTPLQCNIRSCVFSGLQHPDSPHTQPDTVVWPAASYCETERK